MTYVKYLVETDRKLIFILGSLTAYDDNCHMAVIHKKEHKHLFLTDKTSKFKQMNKENIDIQMDIAMASQYLEYHVENTFLNSYRQINQRL